MDLVEINNWKAIAESMEAKGDTERLVLPSRSCHCRWQARPIAQRVGADERQCCVMVTNTVTQDSPFMVG